ncbi:PAS domain-containing protein [candidate division WOR-3 bacterium]|nr:PAS domain-containing protein [candidate division WOR-3 bacterium]
MEKLILTPTEISAFLLHDNKCVLIEEGRIIYANESMRFLFSSDPIGYFVTDLFQKEDFSENSRLNALLRKPQKSYCFWLGVHMVIDRIIYPSNILVSSISIKNKWIWRLYAFFDIDDFFKRYFSSSFLDYIPDAVAFLDTESNIISANKVFLETFGYQSKDEIFKKNIDNLIVPKNEYNSGKELTKNIMRGMRLGQDDVPRIRKDGSAIWVSIAGGPVYFEDEKYSKNDTEPIGIVVIYRDVTDVHENRIKTASQETRIQNYYEHKMKANDTENIQESMDIIANGFLENSFLGVYFNINTEKGRCIIRKGFFENKSFDEAVEKNLKQKYRKKMIYITEKNYHVLDLPKTCSSVVGKNELKLLFSPIISDEDINVNEFPANYIIAVSEPDNHEYKEELFSMYSQTIHILTQKNILKENRENLLKTEVLLQTAGAVSHHITQPLTVAMLAISQVKETCADQKTKKQLDIIMDSLKRMESEIAKLRNIAEYNTEKYIGDTKIINLN